METARTRRFQRLPKQTIPDPPAPVKSSVRRIVVGRGAPPIRFLKAGSTGADSDSWEIPDSDERGASMNGHVTIRRQPGERPSRRRFLGAATAGLAVLLARGLGRTSSARADDGDPVKLGQDNIANGTTQISSSAQNGFVGYSQAAGRIGVWGQDGSVASGGVGVKGTSIFGDGVLGMTSATSGAGVLGEHTGNGPGVRGSTSSATSSGVLGQNTGAGTGVRGTAGDAASSGVLGDNTAGGYGVSGTTDSATKAAVWGNNEGAGPGVQGDADSATNAGVSGKNVGGGDGVMGISSGGSTGSGVHGENSSNGNGITGVASGNGAGVLAEHAEGGTALRVLGKALFSRSGIATIPGNQASVTISGVDLTGASGILATLQKLRPGRYVIAVVPDLGANTFTIHLNNAINNDTKVAWFVFG